MRWLGYGGSIRENPVPNLDCDSAQATGEVRLTPNFANHLVMLFKYGLHQKSRIPGLLLSQPPLIFLAFFWFSYRLFSKIPLKCPPEAYIAMSHGNLTLPTHPFGKKACCSSSISPVSQVTGGVTLIHVAGPERRVWTRSQKRAVLRMTSRGRLRNIMFLNLPPNPSSPNT